MKKETADKLLILILLLVSGNHPFYELLYTVPTSVASLFWIILVLFFYLAFNKGIKFNKYIVVYLFSGIILLLLYEYNNYLNFNIGKIARFLFVVLFPFLVLNFISYSSFKNLPLLTIRLIQFSLVFWLPSVILSYSGIYISDFIPKNFLFPDIGTEDVIEKLGGTHVLFYNFRNLTENIYFIFRNNGLYWEPGAFAGIILFSYLFLILYIDLFKDKELKKIRIWFFLGVLSTFSTTGLIIFPFILTLDLLQRNKSDNKNLIFIVTIIIPFIIVLSYILYYAIPVLHDKIDQQLDAVLMQKTGSYSTRFGSLLFLSSIIALSPFLGEGIFTSSVKWENMIYLWGYNSEAAMGNGMFLFIAQAGIPLFIIISFLWYFGLRKKLNSFFAIAFLAIIFLLLQGEDWMNYPIIYSFFFLKKIHNDN